MINWTSNSKFLITITSGGTKISRILQIFSVFLNIDTDGSLQLPFTPPSHPFYLPLGPFFFSGVYISLISNTTFYPTGKYPSSDPVSVYYSVQCYPSSPSSILYLSFLLFSTDVFTTQVTSVQHGYLIQTNQDHQMNTHIND